MNDHELKARALMHWANHIETGNPANSAEELKRVGRASENIALTSAQSDLVGRLRLLSVEELKLSSKITLDEVPFERPRARLM